MSYPDTPSDIDVVPGVNVGSIYIYTCLHLYIYAHFPYKDDLGSEGPYKPVNLGIVPFTLHLVYLSTS